MMQIIRALQKQQWNSERMKRSSDHQDKRKQMAVIGYTMKMAKLDLESMKMKMPTLVILIQNLTTMDLKA